MTNYDELVKRLRDGCDSEFDGECSLTSDDARLIADAITRLQADKHAALTLIAALEKENAGLQADLKEAVEALKPFSTESAEWNADEQYSPLMETGDSAKFTISDLRRAAAIVSKHEGKKG